MKTILLNEFEGKCNQTNIMQNNASTSDNGITLCGQQNKQMSGFLTKLE